MKRFPAASAPRASPESATALSTVVQVAPPSRLRRTVATAAPLNPVLAMPATKTPAVGWQNTAFAVDPAPLGLNESTFAHEVPPAVALRTIQVEFRLPTA